LFERELRSRQCRGQAGSRQQDYDPHRYTFLKKSAAKNAASGGSYA
jgi:hypothetical protein